jgi:serine phosphatase RsbU (regulator of sigma subunit)
MLPEIPKMKEGITYIVPGSILTCFTDGLIEQSNEDEEEYDFENLKRVVMQNFDKSSKELNNALIDDLNIFRGGKGFIDDIALLSSRFR